VPTASHRYLPDVSLDGSDMFFGNYGMLVYTQKAMATTGGTSAASPSFAGVMALIVQKYGRQGNANVKLYQLGAAQFAGTGPSVFHDITSGNNNVPGLTGFTAGTGWDEVTGLGTPDVTLLVNNWGGSTVTAPTITTQPASQTVTVGATATFTVAASGTAPLSYQWYKNGSAVSGATAASYVTPAATTADNGSTFYAKVTNTAGSATSSTATLTVTSSTGSDLILNGGFESGSTSWTATSGVIAANGTSEPAYAGTYDAWLCGYGKTHTDSVAQSVKIPSTAASATLAFYLHIDTKETGSVVYDTLKAQVRNSSGTVLATLATYSNVNAASGYQLHSFDLSAYKGQTVQIYFVGTEDSSLQTSFVLDNISLKVQ